MKEAMIRKVYGYTNYISNIIITWNLDGNFVEYFENKIKYEEE